VTTTIRKPRANASVYGLFAFALALLAALLAPARAPTEIEIFMQTAECLAWVGVPLAFVPRPPGGSV
jgi:hypothetical protein